MAKNMRTCQTPVKFWGIYGTKKKTPEFSANRFPENPPVTKQTILSYFGAVYDPLGIISFTMAKGKHVYRQACNEKGTLKCRSLYKFERPCSLLGQDE